LIGDAKATPSPRALRIKTPPIPAPEAFRKSLRLSSINPSLNSIYSKATTIGLIIKDIKKEVL
jgi:hypothetical protein